MAFRLYNWMEVGLGLHVKHVSLCVSHHRAIMSEGYHNVCHRGLGCKKGMCVCNGGFGILPAAPFPYAQSGGCYHVGVLLTGGKSYIHHATFEGKSVRMQARPWKGNVNHVFVSSRKVFTGP